MKQTTIQPELFQFLKELAANNNREWFAQHKPRFQELDKAVKVFGKALEEEMLKHDMVEPVKIYRIYRDVRFSKNKLPYKSYLGGYYRRFGAARRGSYAFDIEPGKSRVGGGFWGPNTDDLLRIRKEFEMDISTIEDIVQAPSFVQHFGQLQGNGVKTAPRGFDKTHPHIYWIRKKQFYAYEHFPDSEVIRPDFADQMTASFLAIRPFFDYMTDVLTTDMNGVSIL